MWSAPRSSSPTLLTLPWRSSIARKCRRPSSSQKGVNALAPSRSSGWRAGMRFLIAENPPLAQALYRSVEVGQTIPAKLYAAVAEILAFLYRAQMRAQQAASSIKMTMANPNDKTKASFRQAHLGMDHSRSRRWPWSSSCWCPCPASCWICLLAISITASVLVLLSAVHILPASTVLRFSQSVVAAYAVPSVAEPGQQPPHPAARQRGRRRRRAM